MEGGTEGGKMVNGRRPLVMASLTEVRAVPRTLLMCDIDFFSFCDILLLCGNDVMWKCCYVEVSICGCVKLCCVE